MTQATMSRREQAELFVIEMDAVEAEIQQTSDWRLGASCQAELEAIKSEIVALGYEVKRVPTGWALVEPVVEVAQAAPSPEKEETMLEQKYLEKIELWAGFMGRDMAVRQYTKLYAMSGLTTFFSASEIEMNAKISARSQATEYKVPQAQYAKWEILFVEAYSAAYRQAVAEWKARRQEREVAQVASAPTVELHEDEQGLYAEVPSSTGKTAYTVRVCAKWLYTVSCDCAARGDCRHRVQVDRALDTVRPTFSEQVKGVTTSREVIARLVGMPDRYSKPLKGSGVTGFRHAEIAQKLAA